MMRSLNLKKVLMRLLMKPMQELTTLRFTLKTIWQMSEPNSKIRGLTIVMLSLGTSLRSLLISSKARRSLKVMSLLLKRMGTKDSILKRLRDLLTSLMTQKRALRTL
jgi:hypothetical protein